MILHKIFHLQQTVEGAQANLADVAGYRDSLGGVEQAEFTGHGISHWRVRLAPIGLAGPEVRLATSGVAAEMRLLGEYAALIGRPVPQPTSG